MYIMNVRLFQRTCFMMVSVSTPLSFITMAPPARSECDPTLSESIPDLCIFRLTTEFRIALMMSAG